MPSKSSSPITVRLPKEVLDAVESEAEALGMSRSEVVSRRLKRTLLAVPGVRKTDVNVQDADEYLPEEGE